MRSHDLWWCIFQCGKPQRQRIVEILCGISALFSLWKAMNTCYFSYLCLPRPLTLLLLLLVILQVNQMCASSRLHSQFVVFLFLVILYLTEYIKTFVKAGESLLGDITSSGKKKFQCNVDKLGHFSK